MELLFHFICGVVFILTEAVQPGWHVCSRVSSADHTVIAENVIANDNRTLVGRIRIWGQLGTVYEADFKDTLPGAFMKWTSESQLTVFLPGTEYEEPVTVTSTGAVQVTYVSFNRLSARDETIRSKVREAVNVDVANVSAQFTKPSIGLGRGTSPKGICRLQIAARNPAAPYARAALTLEGTGRACRASNDNVTCPWGLDSVFDVAFDDARQAQILTSATVAELPIYSVLTDGTDNRSIRGQVSPPQTLRIYEMLKSKSLDMDFNFDFQARSAKFRVPLQASPQVDSFLDCLTDRGQ